MTLPGSGRITLKSKGSRNISKKPSGSWGEKFLKNPQFKENFLINDLGLIFFLRSPKLLCSVSLLFFASLYVRASYDVL